MAAPPGKFIDVRGRVEATVDGRSFDIVGDGGTLTLRLPDEAALRALVHGLPPGGTARGTVARRVELLDRTGLRFTLDVGGKAVLSAGHGVAPSLTARLAGLGKVDASAATLVKLKWMAR